MRPSSSSSSSSSKFIRCLVWIVFLVHCHWHKVNAFLTTTTVPSIASFAVRHYHSCSVGGSSRHMPTAAVAQCNDKYLTSNSNLLRLPFLSFFSSFRNSRLYATTPKRKKSTSSNSKKGSGSSSSGFGGAAIEPCPCGSSLGYAKCCGKIHSDLNAYKTATAEQVVRARYSAYAKRQIEFIMGSTHPLNKNFDTDMKHWKETIRTNCYDNFELTKCEIVEETYDEIDKGKATVTFIAEMIQRDSKEKTGFMETATFEVSKTHGGWLYRDGTIEMVPGLAVVLASTESAAGSEDLASPEGSVDQVVDME